MTFGRNYSHELRKLFFSLFFHLNKSLWSFPFVVWFKFCTLIQSRVILKTKHFPIHVLRAAYTLIVNFSTENFLFKVNFAFLVKLPFYRNRQERSQHRRKKNEESTRYVCIYSPMKIIHGFMVEVYPLGQFSLAFSHNRVSSECEQYYTCWLNECRCRRNPHIM